jgi:hypothetical protein
MTGRINRSEIRCSPSLFLSGSHWKVVPPGCEGVQDYVMEGVEVDRHFRVRPKPSTHIGASTWPFAPRSHA